VGADESYPQVDGVVERICRVTGGADPARMPYEEGGGAGRSVREGLGRQLLWFFTGHGR
jgi:hypothetical protein